MAIEYRGCHLAIPMSEHILYSMALLRMSLATKIPEAREATFQSPHVTVWHLGKASDTEVNEVLRVVGESSHLLRDERLIIGGLIILNVEGATVLCLKVKCNGGLFEFRRKIEEVLPHKENYFPYNPHLTIISEVKTEEGKQFLQNLPPEVEERFEKTKMEVPVIRLGMFAKSNKPNKSIVIAIIEV